MSTTQSWAGLPDHIKRQAAPAMLEGKRWHFYGLPVEMPGQDELRKWAAIAPERPLSDAGDRGRVSAPYRGNADKRQDGEAALKAAPGASNRMIARKTGTTHPFVSNPTFATGG